MDITVQQVELLSDDDYIYLDVRGEIAYQHGHIPKAYEWAGDFSHIKELPRIRNLSYIAITERRVLRSQSS